MNVDKLRYDLALAYAQAKLSLALTAHTLECPDGISESAFESDYLLHEFKNAYANYSSQNITIE